MSEARPTLSAAVAAVVAALEQGDAAAAGALMDRALELVHHGAAVEPSVAAVVARGEALAGELHRRLAEELKGCASSARAGRAYGKG